MQLSLCLKNIRVESIPFFKEDKERIQADPNIKQLFEMCTNEFSKLENTRFCALYSYITVF